VQLFMLLCIVGSPYALFLKQVQDRLCG